jgi:hypothetical protein
MRRKNRQKILQQIARDYGGVVTVNAAFAQDRYTRNEAELCGDRDERKYFSKRVASVT